MHPGNYLEILEFSIKFHGLESHGIRLSNAPGYPGNLLELLKFFLLEILEFCWNFVRSAGNFMVLYSLLRLI